MKNTDFLELAKHAFKIAEDKKGENIVLLDVKGLTEIANYFVIVTANSFPQINGIASEIEKTFKYDFNTPVIRRDGIDSANWRVLDFGGLLVHIMHPSVREQYGLEKIWAETSGKKNDKIKKQKNIFAVKKKQPSKRKRITRKKTK